MNGGSTSSWQRVPPPVPVPVADAPPRDAPNSARLPSSSRAIGARRSSMADPSEPGRRGPPPGPRWPLLPALPPPPVVPQLRFCHRAHLRRCRQADQRRACGVRRHAARADARAAAAAVAAAGAGAGGGHCAARAAHAGQPADGRAVAFDHLVVQAGDGETDGQRAACAAQCRARRALASDSGCCGIPCRPSTC